MIRIPRPTALTDGDYCRLIAAGGKHKAYRYCPVGWLLHTIEGITPKQFHSSSHSLTAPRMRLCQKLGIRLKDLLNLESVSDETPEMGRVAMFEDWISELDTVEFIELDTREAVNGDA